MVQAVLLNDGAALAAWEKQDLLGNNAALKVVVLFLHHAVLGTDLIEHDAILGDDGFSLRLALRNLMTCKFLSHITSPLRSERPRCRYRGHG